jgi:ketosteroid isomerase-like protein
MSSEAEIIDLEARRGAALVSCDMATLDRLFCDDIVHVHTTGLVQDKAALLAHIESRAAFIAVERRNLKVRVYGDTAVITGDLLNTMRRPGATEPVLMKAFATQVARKVDGEWRFASFHACLRPES